MSNELKTPLTTKPKPVAAVGTIMAPVVGTSPGSPVVAHSPRRKAFSIERGMHGWCFVTITYTDDGKVFDVDRTQPDLKVIVLEKFKIAAAKYWNEIG